MLGNFVFINEENKSKEIQGKNVLSFTKFVPGFCPGGFWLGGFLSGGFCRGGLCLGVFCPDTVCYKPFSSKNNCKFGRYLMLIG